MYHIETYINEKWIVFFFKIVRNFCAFSISSKLCFLGEQHSVSVAGQKPNPSFAPFFASVVKKAERPENMHVIKRSGLADHLGYHNLNSEQK